MTRRTRSKALLAASEQKLGRAVAMTYQALTLPEPLNRFSGKTRQFPWNDCLDFADRPFARTTGRHN